ncbi:MAG: hypothetical protein V4642_12000 [Bacteroidota bacterium]
MIDPNDVVVNTRCAIASGGKIQVWKDVSGAIHFVRVLDKSKPPAEQQIFKTECATRREAEKLFSKTCAEYGIAIEQEESSSTVEFSLPVLK